MQIDPRLREGAEYEEEEEEVAYDQETQLGYNPQLDQTQAKYDRDLDHNRQAKKKKLQQRFEHIFEKYGRDFEGIGDEIDLETGLIVVDNGHLKNMQHEVDPGDNVATTHAHAGILDTHKDETIDAPEDSGSDGGSEDGFGEDEDSDDQESTPGDDRVTDAAPDSILDQIPSLRASMVDFQAKQKSGQAMNQDAIEALGMSIARQLGDFMNQSNKQTAKRKRKSNEDPVWSYPELPGQVSEQAQLQKRRRRTASPLPDYTGPSPNSKSLWAPMRHPKPRKKRKTATQDDPIPQSGQEDNATSVFDENDESTELADDGIIAESELAQLGQRKCYNCQCSNSLIWRTGPEGMMCNACGMYYYRYGLIRPIEAPNESDDPETSDDSDVAVEEQASQYSANTSRRRVGVKLYKNERFKMEDDAMLIKLKEIDRLSWERIAKHFEGRTAYGLQCRYSKKLHVRPVEARAFLANQGYESWHDENGVITFSPAAQQSTGWTEEEDDLLLKLREGESLDWEQIAASFPGRTGRAMERRFKHLARKLLNQNTNKPRRKARKRSDSTTRLRMRYSEKEDEVIVKLREVDKLSWAEISQKFPGRNAVALQKRYVRELAAKNKETGIDPLAEDGDFVFRSNPLRFSRYVAEEDEMLLHLREDLGLDWNEIEERMPGRKSQSLENRYQYIVTKGIARKPQLGGATAASGAVNGISPSSNANADGAPSEDELLQDTEELMTMPSFSDPSIQTDQYSNVEVSPNDSMSAVENLRKRTEAHSVLGEAEENFTTDEDNLIIKLRELEYRPWDAVAKHFPGRSWSSISDRYYQTLRPRLPTGIQTPLESSASSVPAHGSSDAIAEADSSIEGGAARKPGARWTQGELDTLSELRDQGLRWPEIQTQMPWRSEKAIKLFYNTHVKNAKRKPARPVQSTGTTLLRQALGNNMRRYSESLGPPTNKCSSLIDFTTDDSDDEASAQLDRELSTQAYAVHPPSNGLLPRALPRDADDLPYTSEAHARAHPAFSRTAARPSALSRYLAGTLKSPPRSGQSEKPVPNYPKTPARHEHTEEQLFEHTIGPNHYFTPMRYDSQAHPYYIAPPARRYTPSPTWQPSRGEGTDVEATTNQADPVPEATSQGKANDATTKLSKVAKAPLNPPASQHGRYLAPKTDVTKFDTNVEEEQSTQHEELLYDEESASEEVSVYEVDSESDEAAAKEDPIAVDKTSVKDIKNKASTIARQPPPYSWIELITLALKSHSPRPMLTRDIYAFLEERFPYFKTSPSYKHSIRGHLSSKPEFVKVTDDFRALWALRGSTQTSMSPPKRGRPRVRPLQPEKKPADAPRRRGRPPKNPNRHAKSSERPPEEALPSRTTPLRRSRRILLQDVSDNKQDDSNPLDDGGDTEPDTEKSEAEDELSPPKENVTKLKSFRPPSPAVVVDETNNEINELPQIPNQTGGSDIDKDPVSSPDKATPHDSFMESVNSFQEDVSEIAKISQALQSSSPILAMKTPASVYGKAGTPGTDHSTLFSRPQHRGVAALRSSFGGLSASSRSSPVAPGSRKRVVYTPVRETDDSEDELA